MKLIVKAENGGVFHNYTIEKDIFLALCEKVFEGELDGQQAWKKIPVKAGGAVSGFLHAYNVHEKKVQAYGSRVYPLEGETFGAKNMEAWLGAWMHENDNVSTIEKRQAAWDKRLAAIVEDTMKTFGCSEEKAREHAMKHSPKRPEAKKDDGTEAMKAAGIV